VRQVFISLNINNMAFLRKERKDTGTYIRIVQSYRDEQGKSRHRTLYNLGKVVDYEPAALKKIGQTPS
jgi:hypothetical protein